MPTLILASHQPLGPLSVLFPSNFFIKTLYTSRPNPHFNIILPSNPGSPKCSLYFIFLHQIPVQALKNFPTLILPSHQLLGTLSVLFPSDYFINHSTHLDKIRTLILSSHQPLGPLSVLFPSDFFIKTLYTPREYTHINIILPSSPGSPKCSLYFKFLHQNPVQALTNFPTLILSSHQTLGPLGVPFPSDFFIKTLQN